LRAILGPDAQGVDMSRKPRTDLFCFRDGFWACVMPQMEQ
jgi:hypothetical protein